MSCHCDLIDWVFVTLFLFCSVSVCPMIIQLLSLYTNYDMHPTYFCISILFDSLVFLFWSFSSFFLPILIRSVLTLTFDCVFVIVFFSNSFSRVLVLHFNSKGHCFPNSFIFFIFFVLISFQQIALQNVLGEITDHQPYYRVLKGDDMLFLWKSRWLQDG